MLSQKKEGDKVGSHMIIKVKIELSCFEHFKMLYLLLPVVFFTPFNVTCSYIKRNEMKICEKSSIAQNNINNHLWPQKTTIKRCNSKRTYRLSNVSLFIRLCRFLLRFPKDKF